MSASLLGREGYDEVVVDRVACVSGLLRVSVHPCERDTERLLCLVARGGMMVTRPRTGLLGRLVNMEQLAERTTGVPHDTAASNFRVSETLSLAPSKGFRPTF